MEQELTQSRIRNEQEKQVLFNEAMRRVLDEKEKQIECIREREAALNMECIKYKNTIQQLTDCESESNNSILEKVEALQRDKCQLEAELSMERSRRLVDNPHEMVASVAGITFELEFFIDGLFFVVFICFLQFLKGSAMQPHLPQGPISSPIVRRV